MKKILHNPLLALMLGIFLAACGGRSASLPTATSGAPSEINQPPTPTATAIPVTDIIRLALAKYLGTRVEDVQIHSMDKTQWSDSCLGVPAPGEICNPVAMPGYGGILIAQGSLYEFHSDINGNDVRFIPGAALAARQILSAQLGVELKKVNIANVETVTWKDNCFEINLPGLECAALETPGYRVTLEMPDGKRYQYHTDESGSVVRLAVAPLAELSRVLISWSQEEGGFCQSASFGEDQIAFGACGAAQIVAPYVSPDRLEELHHFIDRYAAFEAETSAGKIKLAGEGNLTAMPVDQRMAAEWARLATMEAVSGLPGMAGGLVFAWHREGGLAGLCEDVTVYLSGIATLTSCKDEQGQSLGQTWLTANQMRTIYTWVDTYQDYDYTTSDPAIADGITTRMIFTGNGQEQMNEFEQTRLAALAEEVLGELQTTPNPADMEAARATLVAYLSALTAGKYSEAVELYGGSYEVLRDNNPNLTPDDFPALFRAGCTLNGFVCNLIIKNFVADAQLSATDFRFTVELQNPDGGLFILGPCCGADPAEEPPWTQFDFLVRKTDDKFKVQDLPVYVP